MVNFVWIVAGNVLNAILDPLLIFVLGFGISGAAAATVISEYVTKCGKLFILFIDSVSAFVFDSWLLIVHSLVKICFLQILDCVYSSVEVE